MSSRRLYAEFFREARQRKRLTQMQVAAALGYNSPQMISNIECGKLGYPLAQMPKLIQLFDLDVDKTVCFIVRLTEIELRKELK